MGTKRLFIRDAMERERDLFLERLERGAAAFSGLGDSAPRSN